MGFLIHDQNFNLDGKELYILWLELDSLPKVSKYLYSKGILNEKTRKPYESVALSKKIWHWVLDNTDEALKIARESGREISDEYSATLGQTAFTLTQTKSSNAVIKFFVNGVRISKTAFSLSGTTFTYIPANNEAYTLLAGDRIQIDYFY